MFTELGAREAICPLQPGRVIERIEAADGAIVVELVEIGPPCRYPAHRRVGADWETPDGRLVCGVCHPPAVPPERPQGMP